MNEAEEGNKYALPVLFLLGAIVVLATYVINVAFGHETYWRAQKTSIPKRKHGDRLTEKVIGKRAKVVSEKVLALVPMREEILEYCSPHDLCILEQVSSWFVPEEEWERRVNKLFPALMESNFPGKTLYMIGCRELCVEIFDIIQGSIPPYVNKDVSIVQIHYGIYDATDFLPQHPGGSAILSSYHHENATAIFEGFSHSAVARAILPTYCIFHSNYLIGRPVEHNPSLLPLELYLSSLPPLDIDTVSLIPSFLTSEREDILSGLSRYLP